MSFTTPILLSSLNGTNGFRLNGVDEFDRAGLSVASGDVNGDGFADLIIGAPNANNLYGGTYVVFGRASGFPATLALSGLDGSNGFRIDGVDFNDLSGFSVASAGDVNGDGYTDVLVGANIPDGTAGNSYVVFGKAGGFDATFALSGLDGNNGFRLDGVSVNDRAGFSVASAGDVNGDGFDDLIVGAYGASSLAGRSYVVFGKANGFGASLSLSGLDGNNGFRLDGVSADDRSGLPVASAGDVNGDGFADLIVATPDANNSVGSSYVRVGWATMSIRSTASPLW